MKIGVYGGTFNPPHLGHVTAARAVFELLKLDLLLLVPDGQPPHKVLPAGSPTPAQRLERALYLMEPRHIRAVYSEGREILGQSGPEDGSPGRRG